MGEVLSVLIVAGILLLLFKLWWDET